ncbi:MAG: phosphodiester glycosidase family protein [Lachnospiraceae bacterium]|nr:phosphodiester glycosidase family protein [Lachnospiraceae bacterium]
MKKQRPIWAICFGLVLAAFTTYVMLDVFVIKRPLDTNATTINLALFATPTPPPTPSPTPSPAVTPDVTGPAEPTETPTPTPTPTPSYFSEEVIATDTFYSNDHLSITISEYRENNTQIHVAEVRVSSAQYLLTAFANDTYGRNIYQKPSETGKRVGAVFQINGDNYGSREGGYVIRNGVLYRKTGNKNKKMDVLCIMPDGDFYFTHSNRESAQDLMDKGVWQAFTFGPVLVDNSEIKVGVKDEVDLCYVTNPRTAIGMIEPLHYIFLVADGRTAKSHGLSIYQVADFMLRLGCTKVYNMDGGGSSTMVFQNKVVNFPTSDGPYYERGVSDIVYLR